MSEYTTNFRWIVLNGLRHRVSHIASHSWLFEPHYIDPIKYPSKSIFDGPIQAHPNSYFHTPFKNRSCTTMYHLSGGRKLPNADKEDRSNEALLEIQTLQSQGFWSVIPSKMQTDAPPALHLEERHKAGTAKRRQGRGPRGPSGLCLWLMTGVWWKCHVWVPWVFWYMFNML